MNIEESATHIAAALVASEPLAATQEGIEHQEERIARRAIRIAQKIMAQIPKPERTPRRVFEPAKDKNWAMADGA